MTRSRAAGAGAVARQRMDSKFLISPDGSMKKVYSHAGRVSSVRAVRRNGWRILSGRVHVIPRILEVAPTGLTTPAYSTTTTKMHPPDFCLGRQ